jgi:iron(III) transport system substrate-binding protein
MRGLRTRGAALLTGAALVVASAAATVPIEAGPAAAASPTTITLYNGQHEQTTQTLVSAFERQTGINVKVRSDDEDVLANQIAQEGSNTPADVFFTENSAPLDFLQEKGLLGPVARTTLAAVPSRYSSPQGDWVGVSARVSVLVYNPSVVPASQLPTSILDLASPKWKGKLGIAPGETDFQPLVTSIARSKGRAAALRWLRAIKANAGDHNYPDNETLTSMVNQGQVGIGVINHYYWYRFLDENGKGNTHSAIAYFAPGDPGYVLDVSGAGLMRSTQHRAAAQRFLAFLVSPAGEQIVAHSTSYEYPLGSGVTTAAPLRPFNTLHPSSLSIRQIGDGQEAVELLREVQLL